MVGEDGDRVVDSLRRSVVAAVDSLGSVALVVVDYTRVGSLARVPT